MKWNTYHHKIQGSDSQIVILEKWKLKPIHKCSKQFVKTGRWEQSRCSSGGEWINSGTSARGVSPHSKKESDLHDLDDAPRNYEEWEKSVPRCHILYDTIIWNFQKDQSRGRKEITGCQGLRQGRNYKETAWEISWGWWDCGSGGYMNPHVNKKIQSTLNSSPKVSFTV